MKPAKLYHLQRVFNKFINRLEYSRWRLHDCCCSRENPWSVLNFKFLLDAIRTLCTCTFTSPGKLPQLFCIKFPAAPHNNIPLSMLYASKARHFCRQIPMRSSSQYLYRHLRSQKQLQGLLYICQVCEAAEEKSASGYKTATKAARCIP